MAEPFHRVTCAFSPAERICPLREGKGTEGRGGERSWERSGQRGLRLHSVGRRWRTRHTARRHCVSGVGG